jgi:hypothetical protein
VPGAKVVPAGSQTGSSVNVRLDVALLFPQEVAKKTEPPLTNILDVFDWEEVVPVLMLKLVVKNALSTFHTFPEGTVWLLFTSRVRLYCNVNWAEREDEKPPKTSKKPTSTCNFLMARY